jgi:hypothetical protein
VGGDDGRERAEALSGVRGDAVKSLQKPKVGGEATFARPVDATPERAET